jgi:hypothetical protein
MATHSRRIIPVSLPLLLAGYFDGHLMEFLPLVEVFDLANQIFACSLERVGKER